jgi:hypothetical protein
MSINIKLILSKTLKIIFDTINAMTIINKQNIIFSLKVSALVSLYIAGFMTHDPITTTASRVSEFVFPVSTQTYTTKLSEYDQRTKDLFTSQAFQSTCEHSARSIIALELAGDKKEEALNFLKEYEKHDTLAQFTLPSSQAVNNRSTSTIKGGTIRDVIK